MKKYIFISGCSLCISILIVFLVEKSWDLTKWANILFYMGMIYLLIGSVLIILRGNFFTAFIHSVKHFFSIINKKEQIIREIEGKKVDKLIYNDNFPPPNLWIITGLSFCLVSLIISLIIVYFGR